MAQTQATVPPEEVGYIPDKLVKAERLIATNPYDTEAWSAIIRNAQLKKIDDARAIYERLVTQFPNAGRYWKIYIEHEMKARNYEKVEKLFQRCLMKVLNIDLWKTYLNYIKETKGSLASYREKMAQAYDFALDKIGMDIMSYQIWVDYIRFLKSVEAVGSYAENQRITAVRKVFQRGVINPMINIEMLWKDYCNFEVSVNPIIAKKMQDDRGRDYQNARRVTKEYEVVTKGLSRSMPSTPPQNNPNEVTQVELWKKYIAWEKSNPLRTEDHATITKRVMFAYEQCLLCLGYHPDVWIEAASYLEMSSRLLTEKGDQNAGRLFADEAAAIYERSITTLLKHNQLLYFAYADFEEARMKHEKVHTIYKRLIGVEEVDPTLAYIQYMRFARRAEGIKAARAVFKMAREDPRSDFHVYIAASLMEYYCSKDKIVSHRIFELGLKKFGEHPEYILSFLEFMNHLNEDNNTRVLFERVLTSGQLPPNQSSEVWNRFLEFESNVGDLASILKVEKRRTLVEVHQFEGKETAALIDRYKYIDLYPCSSVELRALGYKTKDTSTRANPIYQEMDATNSMKRQTHEAEDKKEEEGPKYPMPDVGQMIPFKPKIVHVKGSHPVDGGVFPPPPAAGELISKLPPPTCFHGPFVSIDKFIEHMKKLTLPDECPGAENGVDFSKMDPGTQLSLDYAMGRKRKVIESQTEDSDEDEPAIAPPVHDIYRARQQKKAR